MQYLKVIPIIVIFTPFLYVMDITKWKSFTWYPPQRFSVRLSWYPHDVMISMSWVSWHSGRIHHSHNFHSDCHHLYSFSLRDGNHGRPGELTIASVRPSQDSRLGSWCRQTTLWTSWWWWRCSTSWAWSSWWWWRIGGQYYQPTVCYFYTIKSVKIPKP